jgi:O-antigen ligase/polysaccharide polymerase Wzy-like membrane protein
MRKWVLAVGAAAVLAMPTVVAFFSGGFFDKARLAAAIGAWALVALVALFAREPVPASLPGRLALLGLLLLCGWTALSFAWAPLGGRAEDDLQRLLLYLAFLIAAVALVRGPVMRRLLEPAVVLGAFVVVAYGLSERLFPSLIDLASSGTAVGRLEQPLTYWNAVGILAAVGVVLAMHITGDPTRQRGLRAAAAAAGVVLGLGCYLTYARGALAALAVGIVVLLALAPVLRPQLRAIVTIVGAGIVAAVVANGLSTVKSLSARDVGEGLEMFAALVALAAVAAIVAPRPARRPIRLPSLPTSRPATVLGASVVAILVAGLLVAALEGKPGTSSPVPGATPARLGSVDSNRYHYWEQAGRTFADHPLVGIGSGGFQVDWLKIYKRRDASGDAHSLYLETAAELGVVGVAFLLLFLGGAGAALIRLYRIDPGAGTGLAAGLAAWTFHAGLDWDWEMPAVTMPALLLAAAAIAWSNGRDSPEAIEPLAETGEATRAPARIC